MFYTNDIKDGFAYLSEEESRHCTQVLRHTAGAPIQFVDGVGGFYEGLIQESNKKRSVIAIQSQILGYQQRPYHIHIAIAPTKNIDRLEWFLEKATEMGVDEITPLKCQRSERTNIRLDRLNGVLVSAMKQSLQAYLPKLNDLVDFKHFMKLTTVARVGEGIEQKFIAYCNDSENKPLQRNYERGNNVIILIGPEGDFSEQEIQLAFGNQFHGVSLGNTRLRTETAGLVACNIIHFVNT